MCGLEAQVEYLRGEQDRLKRAGEEEVEQLNSVIEKLQQELSKIEHKQSAEEEEDNEQDQHDELIQKMDQTQIELNILKEEHTLLLTKYGSLQEERQTKEGKEQEGEKLVLKLEDMLREKTAALVVAQVQIQALEESATSTVTSLTQQVQQLEKELGGREMELENCRSEVYEAKSEVDTLQLKISQLEGNLSQKVVNQEPPETKLRTEELECWMQSRADSEDNKKELELNKEDGEGLGRASAVEGLCLKQQCGTGLHQEHDGRELKFMSGEEMKSAEVELTAGLIGPSLEIGVGQGSVNPMGKVVLLKEKLRNLELELSCMPKGQELQNLLLAGSEDDAEMYERMLTKLKQMLDQIRTSTSPAGVSKGQLTCGGSAPRG